MDLDNELKFAFSRSSGSGGQHVNKVNTRVELRFNVQASALLTVEQKEAIIEKLANRINTEGELIVVAQSERTQARNRDKAVERFYSLITKALAPARERKPTKPSQASKERRLKEKRKTSQKKKDRKDENPLPE